ncbi:MAG: LapA family protein [Oleiphilaceae bacterium]|nr:LapA family protein [Oleiphilaceae bacterium]
MSGIRKILIILLVLFLILVVLVFSLNNQERVALDFLAFQTESRNIVVWITLSFVIGALLGIVLALLSTVKTSVSKRHLQKRLNRAEQALEKSRNTNNRAV